MTAVGSRAGGSAGWARRGDAGARSGGSERCHVFQRSRPKMGARRMQQCGAPRAAPSPRWRNAAVPPPALVCSAPRYSRTTPRIRATQHPVKITWRLPFSRFDSVSSQLVNEVHNELVIRFYFRLFSSPSRILLNLDTALDAGCIGVILL